LRVRVSIRDGPHSGWAYSRARRKTAAAVQAALEVGYRHIDTANVHDALTIAALAAKHPKSPAQVMLRWHLQQGRSAIPKSTNPVRIAENFNVFDFELTEEQMADIDALDTGARSGPDPDIPRPEVFDWVIPEN
jgi:diketogulonate reductase-like aldo/keto reductase